MGTGVCCGLLKPTPLIRIRVEGLSLPGFPVKSKGEFAIYVKDLLKNPSFKITGQKPGPKNVLMDIEKPEQVDMILEAGGEINICGVIRPLVG